jgi:uncharacterized protein (TIGR02186 family)
MGLTFGGTTVHVEGSVPDGSSIAVVLAGQEGTVELKKLGKVWGMLWMNVGDIAYERVPSLYMLATSAPLAELAPAAVLDSLGVGYDALTARAVETTEDPERRGLFGELIELKEHEALYALLEGAVTLEPTGDGTAQFETSCRLPSDLRPGTIDVRLFAFRDGAGRLVDHTTIAVEQVGMAATITRLATTRGTLYGVLAVVFALVVGLLTGFIFGRGKKQTGS